MASGQAANRGTGQGIVLPTLRTPLPLPTPLEGGQPPSTAAPASDHLPPETQLLNQLYLSSYASAAAQQQPQQQQQAAQQPAQQPGATASAGCATGLPQGDGAGDAVEGSGMGPAGGAGGAHAHQLGQPANQPTTQLLDQLLFSSYNTPGINRPPESGSSFFDQLYDLIFESPAPGAALQGQGHGAHGHGQAQGQAHGQEQGQGLGQGQGQGQGQQGGDGGGGFAAAVGQQYGGGQDGHPAHHSNPNYRPHQQQPPVDRQASLSHLLAGGFSVGDPGADDLMSQLYFNSYSASLTGGPGAGGGAGHTTLHGGATGGGSGGGAGEAAAGAAWAGAGGTSHAEVGAVGGLLPAAGLTAGDDLIDQLYFSSYLGQRVLHTAGSGGWGWLG